ncbi:hypothetical protein vseg_003476 [Gypsophila vaccaria]
MTAKIAKYKPQGNKGWYFFTPRVKKYLNGQRPNRKAGDGFWKATGADKVVQKQGTKVGCRKALVFYKGRPPKGVKTLWIMHEFRAEGPAFVKKIRTVAFSSNGNAKNEDKMRLDDYILCRIYKKNKGSPRKIGKTEQGVEEDNAKNKDLDADPHPDTSFMEEKVLPPPVNDDDNNVVLNGPSNHVVHNDPNMYNNNYTSNIDGHYVNSYNNNNPNNGTLGLDNTTMSNNNSNHNNSTFGLDNTIYNDNKTSNTGGNNVNSYNNNNPDNGTFGLDNTIMSNHNSNHNNSIFGLDNTMYNDNKTSNTSGDNGDPYNNCYNNGTLGHDNTKKYHNTNSFNNNNNHNSHGADNVSNMYHPNTNIMSNTSNNGDLYDATTNTYTTNNNGSLDNVNTAYDPRYFNSNGFDNNVNITPGSYTTSNTYDPRYDNNNTCLDKNNFNVNTFPANYNIPSLRNYNNPYAPSGTFSTHETMANTSFFGTNNNGASTSSTEGNDGYTTYDDYVFSDDFESDDMDQIDDYLIGPPSPIEEGMIDEPNPHPITNTSTTDIKPAPLSTPPPSPPPPPPPPPASS